MDNQDGSNLPDLRPRQTTRMLQNVGKFRVLTDLEPTEMTFMLLAFVSIVGAIIITIVQIIDFDKGGNDFIFAVLLLVNLVFVLYYTIHGIFRERLFELMVSVLATFIVMLYCITEYTVKEKHRNNLKLGRLIVVCVLGPIDIALGSFIAFRFQQSKRLIFQTVGGNVALQSMCQIMFAFTAFLKFDFQLVISLLILVIAGGNAELALSEKLVIGIGVPLSLFWVLLGFILVRYELLRLNSIFWLIGLSEPAYIIYLFNKTATLSAEPTMLKVCIYVAGVLGLMIRIIIYILSYQVTRNFNQGLKEKIYGEETTSTSPALQPSYDSLGERP